MKRKLLSFVAIGALITACSTDLDINAPADEQTVVYGLIDYSDTVHELKIGRTFLGEASALDMAQQFDSLYYGDTIQVTLTDLDDGTVYPFEYNVESTKPDGIFASPDQVIYRASMVLNDEHTYKLDVITDETTPPTEGTTDLVQEFRIVRPTTLQRINLAGPGDFRVEWNSAVNGKTYELWAHVHYLETPRGNVADSTMKKATWRIKSDIESRDIDGGEEMGYDIAYPNFFTAMLAVIPVDENVDRYLRAITFYVSSGTEEMALYRQVYQPSGGIVQERPPYTNLNNGIGLFTSRHTESRYSEKILRDLNNPNNDRNYTNDSLSLGSITCELRFASYEVLGTNEIDTVFCGD
ncbi:DUF4249 family protein [Cryomorphaceae bacterium]|nr:DUF4249 family protein [Cryomorphaceae bacterium]